VHAAVAAERSSWRAYGRPAPATDRFACLVAVGFAPVVCGDAAAPDGAHAATYRIAMAP
jgi:hypothetical protein